MSRSKARLQAVLYRVFLVTCTLATVIALLLIWAIDPDHGTWLWRLSIRLLGTCVVLAVASALTLSATRIVACRAPEEDGG